MREKLIELIKSVYVNIPPQIYRAVVDDTAAAVIADHLLACGVIVLPCKVGDEVWVKGHRFPAEVECIDITEYEKAEGPVWPTEMARRDCKSFFELPEGLCTCRALKRLYCNFEKCKFYKRK